jgi:hypothetical protein
MILVTTLELPELPFSQCSKDGPFSSLDSELVELLQFLSGSLRFNSLRKVMCCGKRMRRRDIKAKVEVAKKEEVTCFVECTTEFRARGNWREKQGRDDMLIVGNTVFEFVLVSRQMTIHKSRRIGKFDTLNRRKDLTYVYVSPVPLSDSFKRKRTPTAPLFPMYPGPQPVQVVSTSETKRATPSSRP